MSASSPSIAVARRRALACADRGATAALAVVLAVLAIGVGLRVAGLTPLLDHSGSMAPAIGAGDVVLARDARAADLAVGEIATIPDPLSGRLITHRVVSVARHGERVTVVTRGDANAGSERWVLRADAPVGRVVGTIPVPGRLLLALGALPGTASDFTATATNGGNSFAAAAANAAPDVTAAVIGKSSGGTAGYINRSGTFYVYANATDDTAVSSVRATLTNVTGSSTAVTLTAGSYSAGGVTYGYRSDTQTASSSVNGTKSFTVTATDAASLTGTFTGSVIADKDTPSASSIATANKTGGTAGRAEQGDSARITFNEAIEPDSLVDGWDGTARDVQAAIVDGGGSANDVLRVYEQTASFDVSRYLPLGTIDLGRSDFVTSGSYAVFGLASANRTASTLTLNGSVLTIALGSLDSGTSSTSAGNATERYTPVATITDLAGNASGTSIISASGTHKAF